MTTTRNDMPEGQHPWRASAAILFILAMAGLGCYAVLRQTSIADDGKVVAVATLAVAVAMVPPLWLDSLAGRMVASPLVTVAWRLGVMLPVIAFTNHWIEPARNCFQVTLLACYFMTLPLESWLLIRQAPTRRHPRHAHTVHGSERTSQPVVIEHIRDDTGSE